MSERRWFEELIRLVWPGRCPVSGELLRRHEPGPFVADVDAGLMPGGWLGGGLVPSELDAVFSCFRYGPAVSRALQAWKYHGRQAVGRALVERALRLGRVEQRFWPHFPRESVVVPVPLHPARARWRGFSPPAIVASELARRRARVVRAIRRTRNTPTQTKRSPSERASNVAGAFANRARLDTEAAIILVDDVSTTGSTLAACAATLRQAGARRIVGFVLAHSPGSGDEAEPSRVRVSDSGDRTVVHPGERDRTLRFRRPGLSSGPNPSCPDVIH